MNEKHVHDPVTILPLQANKIVYRYYIMNEKHVHDLDAFAKCFPYELYHK